MLLIVTPKTGWRREVMIFRFKDDSAFEAFQALNENLEDRDKYNITLAPISEDQIDTWLENNHKPNWWERLRGRIRYSITVLHRQGT